MKYNKTKKSINIRQKCYKIEFQQTIFNQLNKRLFMNYKIFYILNRVFSKISFIRIKNYCIITANSRNILSSLKFSKFFIKKLVSLNYIFTIKKSS